MSNAPATTGWLGYYVETRDFRATVALWTSLGFEVVFETDHLSGQLAHPAGGPYVFVNQVDDGPLECHPILGVADANVFAASSTHDYAQQWVPEHWGVMNALILDPDGRQVNLQAPLPDGVESPPGH